MLQLFPYRMNFRLKISPWVYLVHH